MLLTNSVLKRLTSLESRNVHSWDLDFLRWVSWVNTSASCTLANTESTETSNGDILSFLELLSNRVKDCFKSIASNSLANASARSDCCN